jgi:hypothetical protein
LKLFNANHLRLAVLASQNLEQVFAGRQIVASVSDRLKRPAVKTRQLSALKLLSRQQW